VAANSDNARYDPPAGCDPTIAHEDLGAFRPDRFEGQPGVSPVWQIVTVPRPGRRFDPVYAPLAVRSSLLLICSTTAVLVRIPHTVNLPVGQVILQTLLPALLLLCVAALASLPVPAGLPASIAPLTETVIVSVVIAAVATGPMGSQGFLFLLYLLVPFFMAGLNAGAATVAGCMAASTAVFTATLIAAGRHLVPPSPEQLVPWLFTFGAIGPLGVWIRRLRADTAPDSEPAYADAHRLLSELHVVARQLSLGLDPQTLATALADDIHAVVPHGEVSVLARSSAGHFMPLIGAEPAADCDDVSTQAWVNARPVRRRRDGGWEAALPVLMGERVVALVGVTTREALDDRTLARCAVVVERSGSRLASAMLFDDVRRVATVDERNRLAREIHDGIAQDLASVGYVIDDIRTDTTGDVSQRLGALREQLRTMVADLRMSIFDLRTGVDDSLGLGPALSEYAQKAGAQAGLIVHVSNDESPRRLPIAVEVELLRMVQEAVTNVRRHADAKNLWLNVTVEPPSAHITVTDDGRGLGTGRPDSFGLTGMRERARRISADLRVGPAATGGTTVEITIGRRAERPLPPSGPPPLITRESLTDPRGLPVLRPGHGPVGQPDPGRPSQSTPRPASARNPRARAEEEMI
jgi:signal transduction histidine kinase